jgi:glucan phosphoethanolaminetransferase (alkaline phosphatase superfamily)
VWTPISFGDSSRGYYDPAADRQAIINDYDNAIHFNSRIFWTNLISETLSPKTIYVYTSDHGQTLGENGAVASHCGPGKNEATVPLFIIADPGLSVSADTTYPAAHVNIFATLLDLMDFPETSRSYSYAPSLLKAKGSDSVPRSYFVGDLHSSTFGQKYPYDE